MAAGFVGVKAVVAHGLFSLGREVVDDGGDEIGGFENFKVSLGGVVTFGAIDDVKGVVKKVGARIFELFSARQ